MLSPPPTFAVPPLANRLLSRSGLEIRPLDPKTGGYGEPLSRDYSGIELDLWAHRFLKDLDLFLESRIGLPALALAPKAVREAMKAKNDLAGTIAASLQPVLVDGVAVPAMARLAFLARLRVKVSAAYAVGAVVVLPGRQRRSRVRLVPARRPQADAEPRDRSVPLPLCAYPTAPSLVAMQAVAAALAPVDIASAAEWTCRFVYRQASESRDRVGIEIRFNEAAEVSSKLARSAAEGSALFDGLARYTEIAPQLWAMLTGAEPVGPEILRKAIETYAVLLRDIVDAWKAHRSHPDVYPRDEDFPRNAVGAHFYRARLQIRPGDARLMLERQRADDAIDWPSIAVIAPDGAEIPLEADAALAKEDVRRTYRFRPEDAAKGFRSVADSPQFALSLGPLDIVRYQAVWPRLWTERNVALLGDEGPATRPAFVFRPPAVAFVASLAPSLEVDTRFEIGRWSDDPAANPLRKVFDILQIDRNPIKLTVMHERTLPDGLTIRVPAILWSKDDAEPLPLQKIIEAVRGWCVENAVAEGALIFEITVLPAVRARPLLTLRQVVLSLPEEKSAPTAGG